MSGQERWLPIGSVVRVTGCDAPIAIAGSMAIGAERASEYLGLPLPYGRVDDGFAWFDRKDIEVVLLVGYEDARAQHFAGVLRAFEPRFEDIRAGRPGGAGTDGLDGAASVPEGPASGAPARASRCLLGTLRTFATSHSFRPVLRRRVAAICRMRTACGALL